MGHIPNCKYIKRRRDLWIFSADRVRVSTILPTVSVIALKGSLIAFAQLSLYSRERATNGL
jgi:hypothetical protein